MDKTKLKDRIRNKKVLYGLFAFLLISIIGVQAILLAMQVQFDFTVKSQYPLLITKTIEPTTDPIKRAVTQVDFIGFLVENKDGAEYGGYIYIAIDCLDITPGNITIELVRSEIGDPTWSPPMILTFAQNGTNSIWNSTYFLFKEPPLDGYRLWHKLTVTIAAFAPLGDYSIRVWAEDS